MKKLTFNLFLICLFAAVQLASATTAVFNVTVPAGTNACYIIGSFNVWDQTKSVKLTKVDATHYTVTLNDSAFVAGVTLANLQYKYCSGPGDWAYVEKDASGADVLNRTFTASPQADVVAKWSMTWADIPPLPMNLTIDAYAPKGTKECYIVGTFNNWAGPKAPADSCKMTLISVNPDSSVHFRKTIHTSDVYKLAYHFCSGPEWSYEQSSPVGDYKYPDVTPVVNAWKAVYDPSKSGTINIKATVPAGTQRCWIQGDFIGWNFDGAGNGGVEGINNFDGTFTFAVPNVIVVNYRLYNRQDWNYSESDVPGGADLPIRIANYPADANISITVAAWRQNVAPVLTNLLTNPGFETWTNGISPDGWTMGNVAFATVSQGTLFTEGTKSFKVTAAPAAGGTYTVSQIVPITPGKTYRLRMDYYVETGDGTDARIWSDWCNVVAGLPTTYAPLSHADSVLLMGPGGNAATYFPDVKGAWHSYTCTVTAPASGYNSFSFQFRTYKTPAVVYWDNMFFGESNGGSNLDTTPPSVPTNLQSSFQTTNSFRLSWNASTDNVGVTKYIVFKDSVCYGTTSMPDMDITGLMAGKKYKMTVQAIDGAGNFSASSLALIVSTLPNTNLLRTFNVTVPLGTYQCWIAGSFNNWNNNMNQMMKVDSTHYTITLNDSTVGSGITEYKYLSGGGDWAYVEKDSMGAEIPNRVYTNGIDVVKSWSQIYNPYILPLPMHVTIDVLTPKGTKECYMVGSFNNWAGPTAPADSCKMKLISINPDSTVIFEKTIYTSDANKLLYHFCSGPDWIYEQSYPTGYYKYPNVTPVVTSWKTIFDPLMVGTIKIRATVPAGTPQVWIQGGFLGWDMTKAVEGIKNADGTFSFSVPNVMNIEYKLYNKPDWNYSEVGQANPTVDLPNRTASYPTDSITNITVWGWKQTLQVVSEITTRTGDNFVLPVNVLTNLNLQNAINSYQFELYYNPQKIRYLGFNNNNTISNSGIIQINNNQPGKLIVGYAGAQYLIGNGVLLNLNFKALEAGVATPQIAKFIFNADSTNNVVVPKVFVNPVYGDIDQNNYVQAYDAALALQYSVGLNPIPNIEPLPWSAWRIAAADVDKSGSVTANDAGIILQYAVKLIDVFPAAFKVNPLKTKDVSNTDVTIDRVGNNILFHSYGNLIGLNVSVSKNITALGTPVFNNQSMMHAINITPDHYLIGLATANSPVNGEVIMSIPINEMYNGGIVFDLVVNSTSKQSIISLVSGINNQYEQPIVVYPNPATDKVWVKINNQTASVIRVFNALGQIVYTGNVDNKELIQLDTRSWNNVGIYQLQIVDGNKNVICNKKLMIK